MAENKKDIILLKRTSDGSIIDSLTGNELLTGELLLCYEKEGERLYAKNSDGIIVPIHHVIDGEEIEYTPLPGVIYSDIEGATVLVNGSPIGTITDGKLEVPNGTINENDTISISGNTGTLPSNKTEYTFNGSLIQEKGNLPAAGGEITISDYVNVESTSTAYTYSYPTETITATTGMVTVELKAVEQTTPNASVPYQPTTYQVSENVTDSIVPHEITITQDESSKTYQFTLNQDAGVAASYTVNYDVEGATVLADNENVGTISGGTLTFQKWNEEAKDSFNITFSGGTMPEPQEAQYDFSVAEDNLEFSESGGTQNVTVTSTKVSYTSAHASGTVNKNDTLSLSHLETSASTNPSYSAQASGDGLSVNGNQITYTANSSTDGRSGSVTFTQSESSKQDVVNVSQEGMQAPYAQTVDLGLPSGKLWAKCNLGANSESGYGLYYQWGDTSGYTATQVGVDKQFDWSDYKYNSGSSFNPTKYTSSDQKVQLDLEDDAVYAALGGNWRMPTQADFQELTANTTTQVTSISGIQGMKFTSKNNSNYLFFPFAGYASSGSMDYVGSVFLCWSSSLYSVGSGSAWGLYGDSGGYMDLDYYYRRGGLSVRGVLSL